MRKRVSSLPTSAPERAEPRHRSMNFPRQTPISGLVTCRSSPVYIHELEAISAVNFLDPEEW